MRVEDRFARIELEAADDLLLLLRAEARVPRPPLGGRAREGLDAHGRHPIDVVRRLAVGVRRSARRAVHRVGPAAARGEAAAGRARRVVAVRVRLRSAVCGLACYR